VPENLAARVLDATGIDISEHWVCMDNYGILHSMEQHGNPISETKRDQIAIEKADFANFIDVFLNPDEIANVGFAKRTVLPLLQFTKKIDDKILLSKKFERQQALKLTALVASFFTQFTKKNQQVW
jgi:phage-Barnase-EndoU-ColicinE5/D-RelE like nuclease3